MKKICLLLSLLLLLSCAGCGRTASIPAPAAIDCAQCGAALPSGAKFCSACGAEANGEAAPAATVCPDCDAQLPENAKFCTECGFDLQAAPVQEQELPPARPAGVPEDAVEFEGHYYLIYDDAQAGSYTAAKEYCLQQGGYLSVIGSMQENNFLYGYMMEKGYGGAYFAYSDTTVTDSWAWDGPERSSFSNLDSTALDRKEADAHYGMFRLTNSAGTWMIGNGQINNRQFFDVHITGAEATTHLTEPDVVHVAERCIDRNLNTTWIEGARGQGYGQSITFYFPFQTISSMRIHGGYQYRKDLYVENSRPEAITLTMSDGTTFSTVLADLNAMQEVTFDVPVQTSSVKLTIDDIYPGTDWEDTAITEVAFRSPAGKLGFICEWPAE